MPRRGSAPGSPARRTKPRTGIRRRPVPRSDVPESSSETLAEAEAAAGPPPALWVGRPLDWPEARSLAAYLAVLADASRLRLLSRIASEVDGQASVGDLARFLELRQPTATHHLQALHRAGFVARIPDDRRVYYRVETAALALIGEILRPPERLTDAPDEPATAERAIDPVAEPAAASGPAASPSDPGECVTEPLPGDTAGDLAGRSER